MKKLLSFSFLALAFFQNANLKSQNTYDPYIDFGVPSSLAFSNIYTGSSYDGEYQLFVRTGGSGTTMDGFNHWSIIAKSDFTEPEPYSLSYKIEVISFPFSPSLSVSGSTNRILHSYSSSDYNSATGLWVGRVQREYKGVSTPLGGAPPTGKSINGSSNLVSAEFNNVGGAPAPAGSRITYPHSILKHTIYLYCNGSAFGKPVDSLEFIIDHTRGNMRNYPFFNTNYTGASSPPQYDILLASTLYMPGSFNSSSNWDQEWNPYYDFTGTLPTPYPSTINYFPYPYGISNCPGYYPTSKDFVLGTAGTTIDYIHPSPYSLSGFELLNGLGDRPAGYGSGTAIIPDGIRHEYVVDQPVDLSIINPTHKVIYNPSETNIDLNNPSNTTGIYTLTFPSGYVFKTVDGIYPNASQVYNADPDRLYNDPREIPVPTTLSYDDPATLNDERKSYYYIKSGSTLKIESCVGIYDAEIVIENGGILLYDDIQTYGNYTIVVKPGGLITTVAMPPPVGGCAHDCHDIYNFDVKDILISTNETWTSSFSPHDLVADGVLKIGGTLRILANKTLTIGAGMNLEFGENAEIIVDKGGKLIINGTSTNYTNITSAGICKKGMWYGIKVKGDGALSQTTTNQGLVLLNYVKISNARGAITTDDGGIIQCQNVEFKNNRVAAAFDSYHNKPTPSATVEYNNVSYFKNCQFLTTALLNDPIYKKADGRPFTVADITMWDVKNVKIESCLFENSATKTDGTALFDTDLRGSGIFAIDAAVQLREFFPNQFKGLSDGVWALSTGDNDLVWISGNIFKNNVHGVTLEATKSSIINLNSFEIPRHEINNGIVDVTLGKGYNKPVGVYLIKATDFTAQENTFTNYGTATTSGILATEFNYGMVVNNCSGYDYSSTSTLELGTGLGYSYKNIFSNLNVNLQAELDNRGMFDPLAVTPVSGGLEYKCNEFNTRINNDVTVPDGSTFSPATSLIRNQGLCAALDPQKQAGNSYTTCTPGSFQQLEFGSSYSVGANPDFKYSDQPLKLLCTSIGDNDCSGFTSPNSCPTNFSLCATIPCLTTAYTDALFAAKQILASYKLLLDGGSTSFLIGKINSSMTAGSLKNLLLSKSPYLSDEVLIATLNRADLPPYGHLEQIFIANSPVTPPVISALENVGLPSGILNNIMSAQTGTSARSEKESEVDYYAFQAQLAEVNLKQGYLKIDNTDSIEVLAKIDTTLAGLFKLIRILIDKGSYADAQICLAKIHLKEEVGMHTDECKLFAIKLNLVQNNKTWFDMSTSQYNVIKQIYQNNPETAIEARAILVLIKGLEYERYPFDMQTARSMSGSNQETIKATNAPLGFKVYPNPSSDYAKVEISIEDEAVQAELIIYNILGAEILQQIVSNKEVLTINTKNFNNGIYLFVLKTDNGSIEKQKVIISK